MKTLHTTLLICCLFALSVHAEPIRLHPDNPHYFLFQSKPTIIVTSAEHYGAVLNLDFDYETYLRTLHRDGLNYTRIFTGFYVEKPGSFGIQKNTLAPLPERFIAPWARSATPGYKNEGNKFDLEKWDENYFARLKDFINKASELGIVVEITLFTSIYNDDNWALSPLNSINNINGTDKVDRLKVNTLENGNLLGFQERLVRKIVLEVNEFDNLIFELQNEPWADLSTIENVINPYDEESMKLWKRQIQWPTPEAFAWQKKIASFIVDEESRLPKKHLIAQNFCNFRYPIEEVEPEVSVLNFHYAWPEAALLNYGFDRVIGFDESGFAGSSDDTYRKQAWNFLSSGGGLFNNLDYSFTTSKEDGTDTNEAPGGGSPALRSQLGILKRFMDSLDFIRMKPDTDVIQTAPGLFRRVLAEEGRAYAIYLEGNGPRELTLKLPQGNWMAEWVDTKTGDVSKTEEIKVQSTTTQLTSPVFEQDIALKVVRKQ